METGSGGSSAPTQNNAIQFQSRISSIKKKAEEAAAAAAALALAADDQRKMDQSIPKLMHSLSSSTLGKEAGSMLKLNNSLDSNNGGIPRINPGIKNKAAERREIMSREGKKSQTRAHSANANLKGSTKTVGSILGGRQETIQGGPLRSMSGHTSQVVERTVSKELKMSSDNRAKVKENQQIKLEATSIARRQSSKIPQVITNPKHSAKKRSMFSETFPKSNTKANDGEDSLVAAGRGDNAHTEMIGAARSLGAGEGVNGDSKKAPKGLALSALRPTKTVTTVDEKSGVVTIRTVGNSPDAASYGAGSPKTKGEGGGSAGPGTSSQKTFVPPITIEAIADRQYIHAYAAPADTARLTHSGSPGGGNESPDGINKETSMNRVGNRDNVVESGLGIEKQGATSIQLTVLDEVKAKKNDKILHQRLQEAKAMDRNRVSSSGAVMHQFSLWNKAKRHDPVDNEMPDITAHNYNYNGSKGDGGDGDAQPPVAKAPSTPTRQPILPGPDLDTTPQMYHGRKTRSPEQVSGAVAAPIPLKLDSRTGSGTETRLQDLKQAAPSRTAIPRISRSAKANASQQLEQLVDNKIKERHIGSENTIGTDAGEINSSIVVKSPSGASREDAASPALSEISQDLHCEEDTTTTRTAKSLDFDKVASTVDAAGNIGEGRLSATKLVDDSQSPGVNNAINIETICQVTPGSIKKSPRPSYTEESRDSPLRWKRGALIGEGTFGKVYKGMNERTGELMAVKQLSIMDGSEEDVRGLQKEISVMWHLDHDNIVRYLGTARSERYLFIVLEYVSGGSIANMLQQFGPFEEKLTRRFTMQILRGVEYLHAKGIIHRDIKGGNVLVSNEGVAKLADFGCSRQVTQMCTASMEESLQAIRGSVPWMAPEMIKQTGQTFTSDIWSVGATVIEMGTGKPPWPEFLNNLAALFHVATSTVPPAPPVHFSDKCKAFLKRCFCIDPTERATATALASDPFIAVISSPSGPSVNTTTSRQSDSDTPSRLSREPAAISIVPSPREPEGSSDEKARVAYEQSLSESKYFPDL